MQFLPQKMMLRVRVSVRKCSFRRCNERVIPFGSRQHREMRIGRRSRWGNEVARGAEVVREGKLCVTARNNAGDARAVLLNDSQAGAHTIGRNLSGFYYSFFEITPLTARAECPNICFLSANIRAFHSLKLFQVRAGVYVAVWRAQTYVLLFCNTHFFSKRHIFLSI